MIIRELKLTSFGKFSQKEISLKDGINLLYGQNEAGKSTIQKFIEGVLYGFFNREVKIRKYTEDYDKYAPWSNPENYQGAIVLEKDGRLLRLERVFTKNGDSVKVLDEVTREDISHEFTYNNTLRVVDPAQDILSVSRTTFVNTMSISQLSCETDDKLGGEVADKIMAMLDTADTDLSLNKVIGLLDKKSDEIGTRKREKSPLGSCCVRIEALQKELRETEQAQRDFFALKEQIEELAQRQEGQKKREGELSRAIERQRQAELKGKYKKAMEIKQELSDLDEKLKELESFSQVDTDLAHAALQKGAVLNNLKEARENSDKEKARLSGELQNLQREYEEIGLKTEDEQLLNKLPEVLSRDERKGELQKEIAELEGQLEGADREIGSLGKADIGELERDIETLRQLKANGQAGKGKTSLVLTGAGIMLAAVSVVLGAVLNPVLFALAAVGAVLAAVGLFSGKGKGQAPGQAREILAKYNLTVQQGVDALENILREQRFNQFKLSQFTEQKERALAQIKEKRQRLEEISLEVESYKTALVGSASLELDRLKGIVEKAKDIKGQINSIKLKLEQVEKGIEENSEKNDKLWDEIRSVLAQCNCTNSKELRNAIAKKQDYDDAVKAQNNNIQRMKDLLGSFTLEELEQKAKEAPEADGTAIDIKKAEEELEQVRKDLEKINHDLAVYTTKSEQLEKAYRTIGEITLELEECEGEKKRLEKEIAAIELAVKKLNDVSAKLHREFAPDLNKSVSRFVAETTGDKYNKVYIDKEMNLSVDHNGRTAKVAELSNGTVDLVYIAMRIGLIDFLQGGKSGLPLIFDDSFTQIDDNRLRRLLSALGKVQERQILIFTCHNREREIIENLGIKFNYIQL